MTSGGSVDATTAPLFFTMWNAKIKKNPVFNVFCDFFTTRFKIAFFYC